MQQLKASMQLFYNDCKVYPPTLPTGVWDGGDFSGGCDDGNTYMREVPTNSGTAFSYAVNPALCSTTCTDYVIGTVLANPTANDTATLTKCSTPALTGQNYKVCND